jgi:hypothetical protein
MEPCKERCNKKLKCGCECLGLCGEKCPNICNDMNHDTDK